MRRTKGISSILGTVIVVAITIALGALLYAYSNGMFSNLTQNVNVNAQAQIIVNPSTGEAYLQFSLTNNGNLQVIIYNITVEGTSNTNSLGYASNSVSIELNPGQSYQNILPIASSSLPVQAGNYYTVIFLGKTSTGKPFSIVLNVLASETA